MASKQQVSLTASSMHQYKLGLATFTRRHHLRQQTCNPQVGVRGSVEACYFSVFARWRCSSLTAVCAVLHFSQVHLPAVCQRINHLINPTSSTVVSAALLKMTAEVRVVIELAQVLQCMRQWSGKLGAVCAGSPGLGGDFTLADTLYQ